MRSTLIIGAGIAALAVVAFGSGLASKPAHPVDRGSAKVLRVSVFNESASPVSGRPEVWLRGAGSWYPNLEYGGDVENFPGREEGTTDTLYFYPEGRETPEIQVPARITPDMCPDGCVRDMVHLEIWDDRYEAWGATVVDAPIRIGR